MVLRESGKAFLYEQFISSDFVIAIKKIVGKFSKCSITLWQKIQQTMLIKYDQFKLSVR